MEKNKYKLLGYKTIKYLETHVIRESDEKLNANNIKDLIKAFNDIKIDS